MKRPRKRKPAESEPALGWLRQSVWSGEELPDELAILEALEPEPSGEVVPGKPKRKPRSRPVRKRL